MSSQRPTLSFCLLAVLVLVGCASPEAQRKAREEKLDKFIGDVTKQVLDKNPDTISESMGALTRNEMTDAAMDKLQKAKVMPDTQISVLRVIAEAQKNHTSNQVVIDSVKALGDVMTLKNIPFQVVGKEVSLVNGKPASSRDFSFTMTAELTDDNADFPRVIDVTGLGPTAVAEADKKPAATRSPREHRRGRRG